MWAISRSTLGIFFQTTHVAERIIQSIVGSAKARFYKAEHIDTCEVYTNSLINTDSFYANFTNTTFQKIPIPLLARTMKKKFLHMNQK